MFADVQFMGCWASEWDVLQSTVERILNREGIYSISEGLDGGVWYSLFIKNLADYSSH